MVGSLIYPDFTGFPITCFVLQIMLAWFLCSVYISHYMSFIRKIRKGDRVYLAEVESQRVEGKVVQRFIRYVGKEADGRTMRIPMNSDTQSEIVGH